LKGKLIICDEKAKGGERKGKWTRENVK